MNPQERRRTLASELVNLERTHYFFGKVLGVDDLTREQDYVRSKARRHNRMLHGWGVVCGLDVRPGPVGAVTVEPGYALDPEGEEIVVGRELIVDLRAEDADGNSVAPCTAAEDVSSPPITVKRPRGKPLHLAIRYAECAVGPVPVANPLGDETAAFSRTRESFAVKVLTALPSGYRTPSARDELDHANRRQWTADPCLDRPAGPWVILADVVLGPNLEISNIDCSSHRRHVPRSPR